MGTGSIVIGNSPRAAAIMQGIRSKHLDTKLGKSKEGAEAEPLSPTKSTDLGLYDA